MLVLFPVKAGKLGCSGIVGREADELLSGTGDKLFGADDNGATVPGAGVFTGAFVVVFVGALDRLETAGKGVAADGEAPADGVPSSFFFAVREDGAESAGSGDPLSFFCSCVNETEAMGRAITPSDDVTSSDNRIPVEPGPDCCRNSSFEVS